ncbi:LysR substrate-binding domain-containing protein [Variovorax sp. J22R24]|uniref:LysR substrate-binding domain-containing protein n=1 Tax=Variovorax gracilis TaxID=3053502 RepID=UPI002577E7DA|nr:LysR substrate-binding domain-containing protein [Variovorax sp. J22R24]MDM0105903.1 LysR substrate-binding domain-containing protein [Variovorax sp. J22R24]
MERSDLELVMAIRARGSLAGAALALNVVPSVVTKRLGALEARLGQRLFDRTTRRLSATVEGEAVCLHAKALLDGFAALENELGERQSELSGTIRLVATFGFGRHWLGPALAVFNEQHPGLQIQLTLAEKLPDLGAEGHDGAVWLWQPEHRRAGDWVTRRIARNQRVLAAAPAYLEQHGVPTDAAALAAHDCLVARENSEASEREFALWTLRHVKDGTTVRVHVRGPLSSNSGEMVRDWCLAGRGIMLRSLWDIAPLLATGELVRVLPQFAMPDADIQWVAPWRPKTPRRVRVLIDFLVERFRGEPWRVDHARPR